MQISDEREEIMDEPDFTYDGYQVVRSEFFAHMGEPSISFNNCKLTCNNACIRRFPGVNYIQVLVNPGEKKLVIRPCTEEAKDSFQWCNGNGKSKAITCRIFFAKIMDLMGWNPEYRYKLLGKVIRSKDENLVVFDLTAYETYVRICSEGMKPRKSRTPVFPEQWKEQFGLTVEEHRKQLHINIFEGYTVFGLSSVSGDEEGSESNE